MKINYLFSLLITGLLLGGCSSFSTAEEESEEFERRSLSRELTTQELELVYGSGNFGFDLVQKLVEDKPGQNHFVSPLSILMAYGMTMNGAEGDTYVQMQKTFGLNGMSSEQVSETAKELIELLVGFDEKIRFDIANSIWYREGYNVVDSFLETNREYFEAMIEEADFSDPATADRINNWVSDKTDGLIEEITDGIDPNQVMYLINAIYFNGDWTIPFDPENTTRQLFYRSDDSFVEVDMMHMEQREEMQYRNGDGYEALNLYYGDAGYVMTLVLPDEEVGLENWLHNMDWNKWQELTDGFGEITLSVEMPKFELEYEVDKFEDVLMEMGIEDAFGPAADFSRITGGPNGLYISESRHKTFISVDEEGTEAAAVTSVVLSESAPLTLRFDRPFFYVIREVESETILFMGTMTDPPS